MKEAIVLLVHLFTRLATLMGTRGTRALLVYVWHRAELVTRINSLQLAHNRVPPRQTRRHCRDPWEENPLAQRLF